MRKKQSIYVIFTAVFLIMVFGLGILSSAGLMNYYINDEIVNNEWTGELGNKFETDISSTFFKYIFQKILVCQPEWRCTEVLWTAGDEWSCKTE